jgi:hypothetical protein
MTDALYCVATYIFESENKGVLFFRRNSEQGDFVDFLFCATGSHVYGRPAISLDCLLTK